MDKRERWTFILSCAVALVFVLQVLDLFSFLYAVPYQMAREIGFENFTFEKVRTLPWVVMFLLVKFSLPVKLCFALGVAGGVMMIFRLKQKVIAISLVRLFGAGAGVFHGYVENAFASPLIGNTK
ncbi:MAG: hypothetical protein BGO12_16430 [Verrucomicrobia bacterium 61-8]|nr:MAG: hypothetical protein BGO12_16430 [Verrucomicrobia bacterium 61-8]